MDNQLCVLSVEQANIVDHVNESLNSPNIDVEVIGLQDVIDDCLMEIFSYLSDMMDLCSIAETCKRFQLIVRSVIKKKISFSFDCLRKTPYGFKLGTVLDFTTDKPRDVQRVFSNFGSSLSKISIWSYARKKSFVLNLVKRHCSDELKHLSVNILPKSVPGVKLKSSNIKGLESLSFHFVSIEGNKSLFAGLDSLVELTLDYTTNCEKILENVFPRLERFIYRKREVVMSIEMTGANDGSERKKKQSVEMISSFLTCHPHLKEFDIFCICDPHCCTTILQTTGSNCTELQNLKFGIKLTDPCLLDAPHTLQASTLLRKLQLHNVWFKDFKMFGPLTELRELTLVDCRLPSDFDQFAYLRQLNKIFLQRCRRFSTTGLVTIVELLVNLEEFGFYEGSRSFIIDHETYEKIYEIVEGRRHVSVYC